MDVLTPWFPASVKPVREGEYLVHDDNFLTPQFMLFWDGEMWRWPGSGAPVSTTREWRGLAFDPASAQECIDIDAPFWVTARPGWWVPKP